MDEKISKEGLTYNDVLLIPQRSSILSRRLIDVSANITRDIRLKMPILSANMDTVTEAKMAIAMARMGGLGVIHRFMSLEAQAEQVKKVKRSESYRVDAPYTLEPGKTLKEANEEISNKISHVVLYSNDSQNVLVKKNKRCKNCLKRRKLIYLLRNKRIKYL